MTITISFKKIEYTIGEAFFWSEYLKITRNIIVINVSIKIDLFYVELKNALECFK